MVRLLQGLLWFGIICNCKVVVYGCYSNLLNNWKGHDHDQEGVFVRRVAREIPRAPVNNVVANLDSLLTDIYIRFILVKHDDFTYHYNVFETTLRMLHNNMKKLDPFYERLSSVQVVGSYYDRLQIKKPYEFDVDITIDLPLKSDNSPEHCDFSLEPMAPEFVQLRICSHYWSLLNKDERLVNKTLFTWKDNENYLLRSKFSVWFEKLVYLTLSAFERSGNSRIVYVQGVQYVVSVTGMAEPEITLKITNTSRGFELNMDLVPVLRFPESRWPTSGYHTIPLQYSQENFVIVPKPINTGLGNVDENASVKSTKDPSRSWRTSLYRQEGKIINGTCNLRQIIRFLKKLRDVQGMDRIKSYRIKTLFLWEVVERDDPDFWRQAPSKLFTIMVKKFKEALETGVIPYFWNKNRNLLQNVERPILDEYAARLNRLVQVLDASPSQYMTVADFMLNSHELAQYKVTLKNLDNNLV